MEKKLSTPIEQLCKGVPEEFNKYLTYTRTLKFEEKPDYVYCKSLFKECFLKNGFQADNKFDWNVVQDKSNVVNSNNNIAAAGTN